MKLTVDFSKRLGKIKPMHAVGQPPIWGISDEYFHYITEIGAPQSRLHDAGGLYARNHFVDIPNIFRNFDADETLAVRESSAQGLEARIFPYTSPIFS